MVSVSPDGKAATCFQNYPDKDTGDGKYVTLVSDATVLEVGAPPSAAVQTAAVVPGSATVSWADRIKSPAPVVPKAGRFRIRIERWAFERSYILVGIVPPSVAPPCPETCERGISHPALGGCCVTILPITSPEKYCRVNGAWKWVPPSPQRSTMHALHVPIGGEVELAFDFELHRATVKVVVPDGGAADGSVNEFTLPESWTDGRPAVSLHHRNDSVRFVPLS
jgi:hypothetical protein